MDDKEASEQAFRTFSYTRFLACIRGDIRHYRCEVGVGVPAKLAALLPVGVSCAGVLYCISVSVSTTQSEKWDKCTHMIPLPY